MTSNPAYLFGDYIKDLAGASIALTDEDSDYPTENSQDEQVALCTRTSAKVAIKYQVDLGSAKTPQIFAILNHNFSGGTYDINSYTADDYSTGKIAVEANKAIRLLDTYHREASAPASRQYWELDLTNATSAASIFEFGRVMIYSDWTQLNEVQDIRRTREYRFRNIINITLFGIRHAHKIQKRQEMFGLTWRRRIGTNMPGDLRTLYEAVYGDAHPFFFTPNISAADFYYVYAESEILKWTDFNLPTAFAENLELTLIEAIRGKA